MYFVGTIQRKLRQRSRGWTPAVSSVSQPGSDGISALVLQPSVTSHGDSVLQHLSACLVTGALLTEVTPEILGGRVLPERALSPKLPYHPVRGDIRCSTESQVVPADPSPSTSFRDAFLGSHPPPLRFKVTSSFLNRALHCHVLAVSILVRSSLFLN